MLSGMIHENCRSSYTNKKNIQKAIDNLSKEVNPGECIIDESGVPSTNVEDDPDEADVTGGDIKDSAVDDVRSVISQCESVISLSQVAATKTNKDLQCEHHTLKCLLCGKGNKLSTVTEKGKNTLIKSSLQRKDQLHENYE